MILLSFPLALIFGIIGIVRDPHKLVATIAALGAGIGILYYLMV